MTLDVITAARRRTRRLVLVVAGTGAVICALVYPLGLYANSRLDDNAAPPPAATTPAPVSGSPAAAAVPVVLPADTTWTTVAGVALPVSGTGGPLRREHGLAAGFAHTPAGAVLAAGHLLVNTTPQVGSTVFAPTLRTQVVGENAAVMRAAVEADYRQLGGDPATGGPVGSLPAALAGARMAAFTDATAHIDLLTVAIDATGAARFVATPIDLNWTGADWALVAPPNGRWDGAVTAVTPAQAAAYPPLAPGR
jgi:hypothetical protein